MPGDGPKTEFSVDVLHRPSTMKVRGSLAHPIGATREGSPWGTSRVRERSQKSQGVKTLPRTVKRSHPKVGLQ